MNINSDGTTVRFKTEPEWLFRAEKSGAKSNTVRLIDEDEFKQLKKKRLVKITIQHQQEIFIRDITHVYVSEMILGKHLAIFSWAHNEHHHIVDAKTDHDTLAHTMSPDALQEPTIDLLFTLSVSKRTLAILQGLAHGRTMDSVIRELHEAYLAKRFEEVGPCHD